MKAFPIKNDKQFKILSLDGGGIRGAFTASFLADIEESIGQPLCEYFDLIAGTSTGAIIAAGLAFRIPAVRIRDFYKERGPAIFAKRWWSYGIMQSRYSGKALKAALQEVFGTRILEEAECRLLIPAINLTGDPNVVFKTPHQPNFFRDRNRSLVDVLLATTAAPACFPQAKLPDGIYADGGLWANNPSMAAYCEAAKIIAVHQGMNDDSFELSGISLLSVGTGMASSFLQPKLSDTGLLWWGSNLKLLDVMGRSQSAGNHFQATYVLGDRYKRNNFDIPPGEKWSLDAVNKIDDLISEGKKAAAREVESIRRMFLTSPKLEYKPFPKGERSSK